MGPVEDAVEDRMLAANWRRRPSTGVCLSQACNLQTWTRRRYARH